MNDYEKSILIGYLLNLLQRGSLRSEALTEICNFLESYHQLLGEEGKITELLEAWEESIVEDKNDRKRFRAGEAKRFRGELSKLLASRNRELAGSPFSLLESNLRLLTAHLEFDATESAIFGLFVRHGLRSEFGNFFNRATGEGLPVHEACAALLGIDGNELSEHLRPGGKLLTTGVVFPVCSTGTDLDDVWRVLDTVRNALQRNTGGLDDLLASILGEPCVPSLGWDDFEHLDPIRDRLSHFLRQAVQDKLKGVNILLWGPPGTGKTEFCKTLAAQLGLTLYAVGETDEDGDEPNRKERMGFYRLTQNLLRYRSEALLMFDEMDDLFESNALARFFGAKLSVGSKVFMNRLLEQNPVPTFWIINDAEILDEAFIRRMSLAIQLKVPPANVRERVWKRVLEKNAVDMPDEEMRRLAELNIPPAVIDSAARFTRQVGGDTDDFQFAAQGIVLAMRGGRPLPAPAKVDKFLPDLTCADLDLNHLTERLCQTRSRAFSLCLYGPPGTGKSAYLRYLAEALKMPVLVKRASDLLDKYVGESEKQIAAAFQEAIDRQAFLIFDEADSLLGDRQYAVRSWEISQVNEMLTWMEQHPLPFACTTNLRDRLDPASLRRFTFKCRFDYLSQTQVERAFEHFFGLPLPLQGMTIQHLTPGDFAVVRRKAEALGLLDNFSGLSELLRQEVAEKGVEASLRTVGFVVGTENPPR